MPKLLRERDASLFFDGIENLTIGKLIEPPYREALRRFQESDGLPITDFDLRFFVEGLYLFFSCHDRIESYLNGADPRWFPEDHEEKRLASFCPLATPPHGRQANRRYLYFAKSADEGRAGGCGRLVPRYGGRRIRPKARQCERSRQISGRTALSAAQLVEIGNDFR